jgi:hypothetical protein
VPDSPRLLPLIKVCLLAMPPYVAEPHSCADKFVPDTSATASASSPSVTGTLLQTN